LNKKKNILICPLEWGLGHAARMIPVAKRLQELGNNIFIGSGKTHIALFQSEMEGVTFLDFSGFRPGYSRYFPQYLIMLLKTPLLLYHIINEHFRLNRIIKEHQIDIVISDNRFGLWNRKTTSVYVTHMPRIPMPKPFRQLEFIGVLLHRIIIRQYSICLIPDLPGDLNLSGRLSHGVRLPDNVRFSGILSRFIFCESAKTYVYEQSSHNTVILSGPEPQRGILKQKLITMLSGKEPATIMLEGTPEKEKSNVKNGNIIFLNHLNSPAMKEMIKGSESVISRSGYSTIMDLVSLNCSALLIPTPGQTEQEYLAEYLGKKGWFNTIPQHELDASFSLPPTEARWPGEIVRESKILLEKALKEILEKNHEQD
jgi:hypothetical protein